jgi:Ni/Co efflux regulator RcnB
MFSKVAIALVAASVFTAPVLAQNATPGTAKAPQTTTAPAPAVKADKPVTRHRIVVRHHRHGAKVIKQAKHGTHVRHVKRGGTLAKQVSGKAAPVKQVSAKPAPKSGVN